MTNTPSDIAPSEPASGAGAAPAAPAAAAGASAARSGHSRTHAHRHHHHRRHGNTSGRTQLLKALGKFLLAGSGLLVFLTLAFLPILWGGRHALPLGAAGVSLCAAGCLWCAGTILRGRWLPRFNWWAVLLFGPLIAVSLAQLSPAFFEWVANDAYREIWQRALSAQSLTGVKPVLAAIREMQIDGILTLTLGLIFCLVCSALFDDNQKVLWLVLIIILASLVSSVTALIQLIDKPDLIIFAGKAGEKVASGGFFNRNHTADFSLMGFFLAMGSVVALVTSSRHSGLRKTLGERKVRFATAGLAAAALTCFLTVALTYSRTAILLSIAGIFLFAVWMSLSKGRKAFSVPMLLTIAGVGLVSIVGLDLLIERLELALSGTDSSGLVRMEIWRIMAKAIALSPWFGSGFGAAREFFPMFDTSFLPNQISYDAHNDYLDMIAQFGLIAGGLVIALGALLVARTLVRLIRTPNKASSYYPVAVAAFLAICVVLGHEFVEYGLKQPANLLLFCALGIALSRLMERIDQSHVRGNQLLVSPAPAYRGIVGIGSSAFLLIAALAYVGLGYPYVNKAQEGRLVLNLEQATLASRLSRTISHELLADLRKTQAEKLLARFPENALGLTSLINANTDLLSARSAKLRAEALTAVTGVPVTPRQVTHRAFIPYQRQALMRLADKDRLQLAQDYTANANLARRLTEADPLNPFATSSVATLQDENAYWLGKSPNTLALHQYALSMYPMRPRILQNAISSVLAMLDFETDGEKRKDLTGMALEWTGRLAEQRPRDLTRLLPALERSGISAEKLSNVVPQSISGLEIYVRYLIGEKRFDEALRALEAMNALNEARLEEELPWTMGRLAYLKRERRTKPAVTKRVEELRLLAYRGQGDEDLVEQGQQNLQAAKQAANNERLERLDALIASGQWALAEEVARKMGDDPRALVRFGEMTVTQNRGAKLREILKKLEDLEADMDEPTRKAYEALQKKAETVL